MVALGMHALVRRRLTLCAAFCASQIWTAPLAAEPSAALSWVRESGAENCIGALELGRRVEKLAGRVLAAASHASVSVEGRIAPSTGGFVAQIRVNDARGRVLGDREVEQRASSCRELDDALAFVIAVTLDPDLALTSLPGALSDEEQPEAALLHELEATTSAKPASSAQAPPPPSAASVARVRPASSASTLELRAGLGANAALGLLDAPVAALALELELVLSGWSLLLDGAFWAPQRDDDLRSAIKLYGGELALSSCPPWLTLGGRDLQLGLCAGAATAYVHAEPVGLGTGRGRFRAGPSVGLRGRVALSRRWALLLLAAGRALWPGLGLTSSAGTLLERPRVPSASLSVLLQLRF